MHPQDVDRGVPLSRSLTYIPTRTEYNVPPPRELRHAPGEGALRPLGYVTTKPLPNTPHRPTLRWPPWAPMPTPGPPGAVGRCPMAKELERQGK